MVSTGSASGAVLFAVSTLARTLDPGAQPFSTANADAAAAWGRGEFERAVMLDPDFGTAWESWIQQTQQSGKTEEAVAIAERALARSSLRTPLNKAQIQLSFGAAAQGRDGADRGADGTGAAGSQRRRRALGIGRDRTAAPAISGGGGTGTGGLWRSTPAMGPR